MRVSRQKEMNIITLSPEDGKKIPVYTKGTEERDKMINQYYKYCDIRRYSINEADLESLIIEKEN